MIGVVATAGAGLGVGLLATTWAYGFRHGFDWDHIAALSDLAGTQANPRRSMLLATLYACGHASVVLALGLLAITAARRVPDGLDDAMGRVVGATLVVLGGWVLASLARHGRDFRLRSRWMLVGDFSRRLLAWARRRPTGDVVVIEHEHEHDATAHHHDHEVALSAAAPAPSAPAPHRHPHRHLGRLPDDPLPAYSARSAWLVGMLHGIGAETPTQVLLFLAASQVRGTGAGVLLLGAFVVGLLSSNTVVALAATYGMLGAGRNFAVYATVSVLIGVSSVVIGVLLLTGNDAALPVLVSG